LAFEYCKKIALQTQKIPCSKSPSKKKKETMVVVPSPAHKKKSKVVVPSEAVILPQVATRLSPTTIYSWL
jgi:hypothetical protein